MSLRESEWFEILFDDEIAKKLAQTKTKTVLLSVLMITAIYCISRLLSLENATAVYEILHLIPLLGNLDFHRNLFLDAGKPILANAMWVAQLCSVILIAFLAVIALFNFIPLYAKNKKARLIASKVPLINPSSLSGLGGCLFYFLFIFTGVFDGLIVGDFKVSAGTNDFVFIYILTFFSMAALSIWHLILCVFFLFFKITTINSIF